MRKNSKMIAFVMAIAMTVSVSLTSCNLPGGSNSASVENPYNEGGDQTLLAAADEAEATTTAATTTAATTTAATTTAATTTAATTATTTIAPVTTTVATVKASSGGSTKAAAAPATVATAKATATPATAVTTTAPVTTTAKATVATTKSTTAAPATTTVATTKSTTAAPATTTVATTKSTTAETTVATTTTTTTATTAETTVATTTATTTAPVATTVTTTAETTVKILAVSEVDWTRYTDNQDILITLQGFKEYIPLIALMNDNTEYNEVEKWHIISGQRRSLIFNHEYAIRTYKGDEVYHKTTLTPVTTEAIVVLTLEDDEIMMSPEAIVEMLDCFFVGEKSERITSSSAVEEFYATGNPSVFF